MIEVRKSMRAVGSGRQDGIAAMARNATPRRLVRWLPVAAILAVAGCSWFSDESTPAPEATPSSKTQQSKAAPEPGEGEAVQAPGSEQEAQIPDINSVPTEAPKPSIVNLNNTQQGLGADTANAQHTDETLTMPNEQAARPETPAEENQPETAQATEPAPPAETPAAPAPVASAPEAAPASAPAPEAAPAATPTPAPAPAEVALAGTPQAGSKPFEPKGPLYLVPGSLTRNPNAAATTQIASTPAATPVAPAPAGTVQQPAAASQAMTASQETTAPDTSGSPVSIDYSALGIGSGGAAAAPSPSLPAAMPSTSVAGVGQAVGLVYFGDGSAGLNDADRNVLRQVAELQRIQGGVLRIIGHASQRTGNLDAQRQDDVNRRVSLERATAVARALVGMGVQPILVQVAAAGDDQSLYAESTPAGEAGNRRAEVYLSQN
jgi:outer membrane protein OmpA-like peptidoglycan-associated protein